MSNTRDTKQAMKNIYVKSQVDETVTNWLKEKTEPIFDIVQNSINENRFEMVDNVLEEIIKIAKEYISHRLDYSTERDAFLLFLHERLVDLKNIVQKNTHPRIMLAIAKATRDIAITSLDIRPVRANFGENFIPIGNIDLLKDICISSEILKETSFAPLSTINFLVDIANAAIDKDFPRTVDIVTEKIGSIAVTTTKLHFLYADSVALQANWGLANILDQFLSTLNKSKFYTKHEIESVLEEIDKSVNAFIEDDIRYHYTMRNNIKPLFGTLSVREHGIAGIYIKALQKNYPDKHLSTIIDSLEEFLTNINQSVMKGMDNSKYLDVKDILDNIYMIGMAFVWATSRMKNSPKFRQDMTNALEINFLYPYINAITMSFKTDTNRYTIFDDDYLMAFFSLMGIMFYENKNALYQKVLETWISKIIEIAQKYKTMTTVEHEGHIFERHEITHLLSDVYRYLRLAGVWLYKYLPKSELLDKLISEIKTQPDITKRTSAYGQESLYPSYMMEQWIVQRPYTAYRPKYFNDVDQALMDSNAIKTFEEKLAGKRNHKKKTTN